VTHCKEQFAKNSASYKKGAITYNPDSSFLVVSRLVAVVGISAERVLTQDSASFTLPRDRL